MKLIIQQMKIADQVLVHMFKFIGQPNSIHIRSKRLHAAFYLIKKRSNKGSVLKICCQNKKNKNILQ